MKLLKKASGQYFFVIIIISLVLMIWCGKSKYFWLLIMTFVTSVFLLVPITQRIEQKAYERSKEVYDKKIKIFRKILSEFDMHELKKIQELIVQCDLASIKYKFSEKISNKVTNISRSIFLPFFTFVSGLIVKNVSVTLDQAIKYTTTTILIIITLLAFIYEIKLYLEEILDNQSRKLHTIKGLLVDISIKDFIKEDKKEISNESYNI